MKNLSNKEMYQINGGGLGTLGGSLLRGSLYQGFAAAHAVGDFINGFVGRFTANAKK